MTLQLSRLHLQSCNRLSLTELRHVHALRGLKELRMLYSFDEPLDSHSRLLFTPPSILFPRLETSAYSPK